MNDISTQLQQMATSACLIDERTRSDMGPIILGYFDDMYLALLEQWRLLSPGGYIVYVVANSRHKYLPVATDVILATIAQRIGFEPLDIVVLKKRNGRTRQKAFLRETAVFLRKPFN